MSRHARVKAHSRSRYYHCMNRVAGEKDWFPFGDTEKEYFAYLIKKFTKLYTIEVISYCIMSNHFHIVLWAPGHHLSAEDTCRRYNRFYKKKYGLTPDMAEECEKIAERMRDISKFLSEIQQNFTKWYNQKHNRRGTLWGERFKSVIIEKSSALWNTIKYIELNPIRAGIVDDPADYRFSSWGAWSGSGKHPFPAQFHKHMRRYHGEMAKDWKIEEIEKRLRKDMYYTIAKEQEDLKAMESVLQTDGRIGLGLMFLRRCNYYTDSLILGSKRFIEHTMCDIGAKAVVSRREARHIFDTVNSSSQQTICSYHHY